MHCIGRAWNGVGCSFGVGTIGGVPTQRYDLHGESNGEVGLLSRVIRTADTADMR